LYLIDTQQPYAQVVSEYDDVGSLTVGYVYGLERISQNRSGTERYYVADGQGSVRYLTDQTGSITDAYVYTAFGELQTRTGYSENEFMYVGEQFDPNVGFYYNRARWMDPEVGRFLSVDPLTGDPQSPLSLHRYLYGNANPVLYSDPSGYFSLKDALVTASVISVVSSIAVPKLIGYKRDIGCTDRFELNFGYGAGAGKTFDVGPYIGYMTAEIVELPPSNRGFIKRRHTWYNVFMYGLGFGSGVTFEGSSNPFSTRNDRNSNSFYGIGNISAIVEIGGGPISISTGAILLPDGTLVDPKIPTLSGVTYGWSIGLTGYTVMAYWSIMYTEEL
jgi:RHS repeat-associated protein